MPAVHRARAHDASCVNQQNHSTNALRAATSNRVSKAPIFEGIKAAVCFVFAHIDALDDGRSMKAPLWKELIMNKQCCATHPVRML